MADYSGRISRDDKEPLSVFLFFESRLLGLLSRCKSELLQVSPSEFTPPDLLCITRPHCTGDIMTYKRKRVEKIPPLHLHRERTDSRAL